MKNLRWDRVILLLSYIATVSYITIYLAPEGMFINPFAEPELWIRYLGGHPISQGLKEYDVLIFMNLWKLLGIAILTAILFIPIVLLYKFIIFLIKKVR